MTDLFEDYEPDEDLPQTPIRSDKLYSSRISRGLSREVAQAETRPTVDLIRTK